MPKLVTTELPSTFMLPTMYIGIDPGVNGGIATLLGNNKPSVTLYDMPDTETDIWELINCTGLHNCNRIAAIEWIHPSIQKIKKSAMSKLYGNYMGCRTALVAAGIPFESVQAQKWQRAMGISKRGASEVQSKWKNRLKSKAQQLFPKLKITLKTCDALLIAEYYRRLNLGLFGREDTE